MTINCIAVDDEPLALALLCTFIEQTPFLKLLGRFGSGVEALQGMHELRERVDVAFLDIQMQELTGLEMARVLGQQAAPPRIINGHQHGAALAAGSPFARAPRPAAR